MCETVDKTMGNHNIQLIQVMLPKIRFKNQNQPNLLYKETVVVTPVSSCTHACGYLLLGNVISDLFIEFN